MNKYKKLLFLIGSLLSNFVRSIAVVTELITLILFFVVLSALIYDKSGGSITPDMQAAFNCYLAMVWITILYKIKIWLYGSVWVFDALLPKKEEDEK